MGGWGCWTSKHYLCANYANPFALLILLFVLCNLSSISFQGQIIHPQNGHVFGRVHIRLQIYKDKFVLTMRLEMLLRFADSWMALILFVCIWACQSYAITSCRQLYLPILTTYYEFRLYAVWVWRAYNSMQMLTLTVETAAAEVWMLPK